MNSSDNIYMTITLNEEKYKNMSLYFNVYIQYNISR